MSENKEKTLKEKKGNVRCLAITSILLFVCAVLVGALWSMILFGCSMMFLALAFVCNEISEIGE